MSYLYWKHFFKNPCKIQVNISLPRKYQEKIIKHENVTEDEKREIEEEIEDIKDTM